MQTRPRTYNLATRVWLASVFSAFIFCHHASAFPVHVSNSPLSDLSLTISAIKSAKNSILLNIYEFTSPEITDALIAQIQAGVQVEILQEGQPVGGISAVGKGIQYKIAQAMRAQNRSDRYFVMTAKSISNRRFHFDHAKYAIIDGVNLLIGSENYSPTGNPLPNAVGNRGWAAFIEEPGIAKEYAAIFHSDANTGHGDIIEITRSQLEKSSDHSSLEYQDDHLQDNKAQDKNSPVEVDATAVYRITSPDTSLSGIVSLIDQATSKIDIEQMTFDSGWGGAPSVKSPIFEAVVRAARRGVAIRVLLNDESVFSHGGHGSKSKNIPTVESLNQISRNENLKLSAAIANVQAMKVDYIHNKGMIVDGNKTLISSINWNENSVEKNREAAVVIVSTQAYTYYRNLFDQDWSASLESTHTEASSAPPLQDDLLCPSKVWVGLRVDSILDPKCIDDFAELQGEMHERLFVRISDKPEQGCILEDSTDLATQAKNYRFVQLRQRKDKVWTLSLEGYTQNGHIFAVRTVFTKEPEFKGQYLTGSLYQGTGSSSKIAKVTLSLSLNTN